MIEIGTRGTVTIRIRGAGDPGEVLVDTPGGSRKVRAYAAEEIDANALVVVYDVRPGGVEVTRAE